MSDDRRTSPPRPPAVGDGGPDMVQLLTPEGQRVRATPQYDDVRRGPHRRGPARLLPRPRPHPPRRRRGHRAAAPGRARHLGQPARPGGGPGRLRSRDAPAGLRLPDLPRARRRLVPRGRPAQPARPVPRRQPRRLGPEREELPPLHDRHRRADAARDRVRDGHPARRRRRHRRPRPRRRRHRLLRRRRDRAGRRQRVVRLRRGQQRPGRLLLPEQPVGHLRAQRAPDPHPALPAGPRLRLPRRAGRRQRRARGVCRDASRRSTRPAPAAARPSSRPTPTGWARTRRRTTRPSTASPPRSRCGSTATRSSGSRPTSAHEGKADQDFFDAVEPRGRRAGRPRPRGLPDDARPDAATRCSTTSTSRSTRVVEAERSASSPPTSAGFEGEGCH